MKLTLFIIALLSIVSFTNAETFLVAKQRKHNTPHLTPEAFTKNLQKSEFGKTILNLASLQFKTSGKLDDVVNLLNGLTTKLQGQQADEDQRYTATSASNAQIIADQSQIVDTANANIQTYTQQRADAQNSLSNLQIAQASLQTEQSNINDAIATALASRAKDASDFDNRSQNSKVIIQGLQATLTIFQQALENQEVDQDAANRILSLLNQLISAFQVSIAQDTQQEEQAIQDFNDWLAGRNARLNEIADQLASIALEISNLETLVAQLTDAIDSQTTTRNNAQALKDRTVQAQADLDQRYNNNKAVRAQQLQLLSTAVSTLQNNSADVQNYLNQA